MGDKAAKEGALSPSFKSPSLGVVPNSARVLTQILFSAKGGSMRDLLLAGVIADHHENQHVDVYAIAREGKAQALE